MSKKDNEHEPPFLSIDQIRWFVGTNEVVVIERNGFLHIYKGRDYDFYCSEQNLSEVNKETFKYFNSEARRRIWVVATLLLCKKK